MIDLSMTVDGIVFKNPVLPAAGPNVRNSTLMCSAADLGAGGIVSKTVSVSPAVDPRPTIMKTVADGMLNCETWSEKELDDFLPELATVKGTGVPLIVSIGYKPEEVATLGARIEREVDPAAYEFSTHYTGSETEPIVEVAQALREAVTKPVWMKLSPGFPDIPGLVRAVEPYVDGFVAINSLGPGLDFSPDAPKKKLGSPEGTGWLSGKPIQPIALSIVHTVSGITNKSVIGVGGIYTGRDAVKFMMAGASLIQVCTAAIQGGPGTYGRIADELRLWLADNELYESARDLVGEFRRINETAG